MRSWFSRLGVLRLAAVSFLFTIGMAGETRAEQFISPGTACTGIAASEEQKLSRDFNGVLSNATAATRQPATAFVMCPVQVGAGRGTSVVLSVRMTLAEVQGLAGCNLNVTDFSTTPPKSQQISALPMGSGPFVRLTSPSVTVGPETTLSVSCLIRPGDQLGSFTIDVQ